MSRPSCIRCRRQMWSDGKGKSGRARWKCRPCGVSCAQNTRGMSVSPGTDSDLRPCCVACRRVMSRLNATGACFRCPDCRVSIKSKVAQTTRGRRALRDNPEALNTLLRNIGAALPGYLTADEREDACQSIMLDIFAGRIPQRVPTPRELRRYAAGARGMSGDRFKFVSLSAPTRDGREFGETLAA
jgi:hypothetical protein